ncbi:hypothetical protein [Glaciihabitans sp. UYNi722]
MDAHEPTDEQQRVDAVMAGYFRRETEMSAYTSEQIRELGRNVI